MYRIFWSTILMVLFSVASESPASAQAGPVPRYYPARSTISPYLNFFMGSDPVVLDRYNAYVRPAQQLQRTVGAQDAQIRRQQRELQSLRESGSRTAAQIEELEAGKGNLRSRGGPGSRASTRNEEMEAGRRRSRLTAESGNGGTHVGGSFRKYSHYFPSQGSGRAK